MILLPKYVICAKMKTFLVIFLWFFVGHFPIIKGTNTCVLDTTRVTIDTTNVGVQINSEIVPVSATYESFYTQVVSGAVASLIADTYFNFTINDGNLILSTTETFGDLGKDAYSNGSSVIAILIYVTLKCDDASKQSTLTVAITDAFVNEPIFSMTAYSYTLPMPIMTKTDISLYGDEISVTDINFSNTNMTFTISPDDFSIATSKIDNKNFKAVFSANKILRFTEPQTYTLIAMNSGNGNKDPTSSNVTITIDVDAEAGLDAPSFTYSYYSFEYSYEDPASLTPKDGNDIVINSNKLNEAQYKLDGDDASYFSVTLDNETNIFQLTLSESPLPSDLSGQIVLTLSFTTDATTKTILLINIVKENIVPTFSSDYYRGTYDIDTNEISWNQSIVITNAVEVKLSKGKSDLFTIDETSYAITSKEQLDKSNFDENWNIVFAVTATSSTNNEVEATVVISLESKTEDEFKFNSAYYTATYTEENGQGVVTLNGGNAIGFSGVSDLTEIKITADASYSANFEFELENSEWKISVTTILNETILNDNTILAIPITATKTGVSNSTTAVLILTLPEKVEIKFGSFYYSASYLKGDEEDTVQLDQTITITGAESDELTIVVEGYENNFKGTCDSTTLECSISVKQNLNSSVLSSYEELMVTVIATNEDKSRTGKTILLLKLPSTTSTFTFTSQHYGAVYSIQKSDSDKATIKLTDVISLEGAETTNIKIISDDYSNYFEFNLDSSTWNLNVIKNLEADILSNKDELVMSLTATKEGESNPHYAKATLIIKLPDQTTVAFAKPQYIAEYIIDDPKNPTVALDTDSQITVTDSENSEIVLDSFTDNFEVILDSKSNWYINCKTPLNATSLSQYSEIKILMQIRKVGVNYGVAGLTIKLPPFSFSEDSYSASYAVNDDVGSINVTDITINNIDPSYVQINLTKWDEYFYSELSDNNWNIKIAKPLTPSILETGRPLITNLVATRQSDSKTLATSTLVILLPNENSTEAPVFSAVTFSGEYKNTDTPTVELKELISFKNNDTISISEVYIYSLDQYSTNFSLKGEGNDQYSVEVKSSLSQDILDEVTNFAFTLVAKSIDENYGYAALVISLPKALRSSSVQVKNQEILFTGTYQDGKFTAPSISIETNNTDDDAVSVKISNDLEIDEKYFTYTYSKKVLTVQVGTLPDDVLNGTSVIPLKLAITDRSTQDTTYAVLNVQISPSSNNNGDNDNGDSTNSSRLGLIIAVSILAALLVLVLLGTFFFWYCKLRKNKYAEMNEEIDISTKTTTFVKKETKNPLAVTPVRRPTGVAIALSSPTLPEESSTDQGVIISTAPLPLITDEKKVAFNDEIENIDGTDEADDEISESLQSVADRRPTKFVFGYPLETGVFNIPDDRRESSDHIFSERLEDQQTSPGFNEIDKKKSVAFDENIERMHIEPIEDEEGDSENDENDGIVEEAGTSNSDQKETRFTTQAEIKIVGDEQLPSQILKEIF